MISLEFSHLFGHGVDQSYEVIIAGANTITVTFLNDTSFESNYDYLYIYDGSGTQIGAYSGTSLAGQTITITGNYVSLRVTTDGSVSSNGFYAIVDKAT